MPELVVLGIAQDAGHPHVGCRRPCCLPLWSQPGGGHRVSCLGLLDAGQGWLVDATPDLPAQLNTLLGDGAEFAGVLLTHGHIGHYTGLMWLGREGLATHRLPVHALPRMRTLLEEHAPWEQLVRLENITLVGAEAGESIALTPALTITPILVPHRAEYTETVGYLIAGPRRRVPRPPRGDRRRAGQVVPPRVAGLLLADRGRGARARDDGGRDERARRDYPRAVVRAARPARARAARGPRDRRRGGLALARVERHRDRAIHR